MRLINGKTKEEVINELKRPFTKDQIKYNHSDQPYVPIDLVEERLDSVLGLNWSFKLMEPIKVLPLKEINNDGEMKNTINLLGCGILEIWDDDGNLISSRASGNGTEAITLKSGFYKDISTDYNSAVSYILSKAAKRFGVARTLDIKSSSNPADGSDSAQIKIVELLSKGSENSKMFRFNVRDNLNRDAHMIIWKDSVLARSGKFELLKKQPIKKKIKIAATENNYNGSLQFIVSDFLEAI